MVVSALTWPMWAKRKADPLNTLMPVPSTTFPRQRQSLPRFGKNHVPHDRDLLPAVQAEGLDGPRHVVGIEAHRHVELEIGGDLDASRRRRGEGARAGRYIDRTARELLDAVHVDPDRARHGLRDGAGFGDAARGISPGQLEGLDRAIPGANSWPVPCSPSSA
jgi:hypothetical protein